MSNQHTPADIAYDTARHDAWIMLKSEVLLNGIDGGLAFDRYRDRLHQAWRDWRQATRQLELIWQMQP